MGPWGLSWIDWSVIGVYFAITLFTGLRTGRKVKTREDYFLGGRKFGKLIQTFAMFGQATSAENAVSSTTMVASQGAAGMGANLLGQLLYMPVLWLTAPWYRRLRALTLADFFAERYQSRGIALTYALVSATFFMIAAGMGFAAMGKTIPAIAPGADPNIVMIVIAVSVAAYVLIGGLEAAFLTDLFQGILIIVLTLLLIPFAMLRINAMHGTTGILGPFEVIHRQLPEWFFELGGSPKLLEFTPAWIIVFGIAGVLNTAVQANQLTAIGSAKDEDTARKGSAYGLFIKRYCTVIWGLVGLLALVLFPALADKDPDMLWGTATRELLGPAGIGLVGLMIACLLAALMSTASTLALTTGALLTNNVYKHIAPDKSERHYVTVGRGLSLLYIIGGLFIAWNFRNVFDIFKYLVLFNCIVAAAFWLGMTWRRANRAAAWASIVVMLVFTVLLPVVLPMIPGVRTNERLLKTANPVAAERTYHATATDIADRQKQIDAWDASHLEGTAVGARPEPLVAGQTFTKTIASKTKSVFWWQDFEKNAPVKTGKGLLKVELVAIDLLGFDLSKNSYSFNETISILFRILVPFVVLLLVGLCTKPQAAEHLDRFYAKLRTPVQPDPELDAHEIEMTMADPVRYNGGRLFPRSHWEFNRWDRADWHGVFVTSAAAVGVIALLILITRLGA